MEWKQVAEVTINVVILEKKKEGGFRFRIQPRKPKVSPWES